MRKTMILLLLLLAIVKGTVAFNPNTDLQRLDAWYEQVLRDWQLPGMAIGIIKDGELIFSKGYGELEVGKAGTPDANTNFAIASNSKAFTAALIAMLVQDDILDWNDKVKDHLPYFELYDPWVSSQVTVRDLLCHRVGLGTFSGDVIWYLSELTAEEIIRRVRYLPQAFDFRAGYGYSNLMYVAAGEVIRQVTGKTWEENIRERILEPLGMQRTIVRIQDLESTGNYASPHARIDGKNVPIDWVDWEQVAATGGLISSVNDVAKWMIFNMNHGIIGNDTLLTRQSFNMLWTPHVSYTVDHTRENDFNRHFNGYGLGWGLSDYYGRLSVGHTGGYDGMISEVRMLPKEGLGVVVLTNGVMSPIGAVTNYTLETLLGLEPRDWSAEMLPRALSRQQEDPRITAIKNARVRGTQPTLPIREYAGTYHADIYGNIIVRQDGNNLRVEFEHSPKLTASLHHWHHDVWEIRWDEPQAWFGFGTLQFNLDNKRQIKGLTFDVPNRDIFFHELKPVRVD
jgi:CubicO group peptidase (beta-lactamase class C family)